MRNANPGSRSRLAPALMALALALATASCTAPISFAKAKDVLAPPVRLFKLGKTNRILVRFDGAAARELHGQLRKNYGSEVSGIVDGAQTACLQSPSKASDPKSKSEYVCGFVVDLDGRISNVFNPNPNVGEETLVQLALGSRAQLESDIDAGAFKGEDIFEIGGGSRTLSPATERGFRGTTYRLGGEDAEMLFHYVDQGLPRRLGPPRRGFADASKSITIERAQIACSARIKADRRSKYPTPARKPASEPASGAKKAKKGAKPSKTASTLLKVAAKDVEYDCRFGFDRKGVARTFAVPPSAAIEMRAPASKPKDDAGDVLPALPEAVEEEVEEPTFETLGDGTEASH